MSANKLRSWADVQAFIAAHDMQYKVQRFNMSNRGALVGLVLDQAIAYTIQDAARYLRAEVDSYGELDPCQDCGGFGTEGCICDDLNDAVECTACGCRDFTCEHSA